MLAIETVAVLGQGEEAQGCAILASLGGCAVRYHHPSVEVLEQAFEAVRFRVDVAIERGLLTRSDRQRILDGILFTPDLEEAVVGADLVADLDVEEAPVDRASPLLEAAGMIRATAALATSTIARAVRLEPAVPQPGRLLALAVDRTQGFTRIQIDAAPHTSHHALAAAREWAERLNRRGRPHP